uniref:Uncharacterized protein n=1 Tax=Arundo donax TaxID=35708 RepID=A0A0A9BWF5_ARUDO
MAVLAPATPPHQRWCPLAPS